MPLTDTLTVRVTRHALTRWRQRGADYGDASEADLIVAFRAARPVPDDEPLPPRINRCGGVQVYRQGGHYFVARRDGDAMLVVTVVAPWLTTERKPAPPPASVPSPERPPADLPWEDVKRLVFEFECRPKTKTLSLDELRAERLDLLAVRASALRYGVARSRPQNAYEYYVGRYQQLIEGRIQSVEMRIRQTEGVPT